MSVYNFRDGPSYTAATREEMFTAAMDMPMNFGATFWDQAKGGTLESFGLGTAIRGAAIPPGDTSQLSTMEQIGRTAQSVMPGGVVATIGGAIRRLTDEPSPVLSEDAYKSSPFFREDVPWDASMTEDRAAALASWHDAKAVRQYFATKRPITAFIGNVAGQAADPINYIPVVGPAVQAAAAARAGRVIGTAATASADAALNTAIAGMATSSQRAQFGDDVSWQAMITEIATAALIGAGFGGIAGGIDARRAAGVDAAVRERLSTLQTAQDARIALNEGIDALARGEDINLSPNATAGVERVVAKSEAPSAEMVEPPVPAGFTRVYHSGAAGEGETGRWVSTNREYASNYRSDLPLFYLDVPETDPRINNPDYADQGVKQGFTFNFETTPAEAVQLRSISREMPPSDVIVASPNEGQPTPQKLIPNDISLNRTASWVIRDKKTKVAVMETFDESVVSKVNTEKYEAVPIGQYLGEINGRPKSAPVDTTPASPEPIPAGRTEAEKTLTRADDYAAMKAQYRVDPETGDFLESAEIDQLRAEGRLTDEDIAALDAAQAELDNGTAYGDALKAAVACII